ncbi:anti-sigma factor [Microbacterium sp. Mu-80]|uniref:Regulator of SigK n=1 Tax=Microbacterium bandirmense TaxID=3122050 RepID=A0ABU8LCC4_9MICO
MNEQEFSELAAGHALHALSDADERRFQEALAQHPEWQALADADLDTAAALADALPPVDVPTGIRAELMKRISTTSQGEDASPASGADDPTPPAEPPADAEPAPVRGVHRRRRLIFALAACLVLLVGVGVGTAQIVSQLQRPASVVALEQIRSADDAEEATVDLESGGSATAHWSDELGKAVLVTRGIDDLPDDESYELWFVRGDQPISAGVFDTSRGNATALLDQPMQGGDVIAVTVEPLGGSPTGAPSSDPVIVIATA